MRNRICLAILPAALLLGACEDGVDYHDRRDTDNDGAVATEEFGAGVDGLGTFNEWDLNRNRTLEATPLQRRGPERFTAAIDRTVVVELGAERPRAQTLRIVQGGRTYTGHRAP